MKSGIEGKAQLLEKGMRPVSCRVLFTLKKKDSEEKLIEEVSTKQELWVEVPIDLLKKQRQLTIDAGNRDYYLCCKVGGFDIWLPL